MHVRKAAICVAAYSLVIGPITALILLSVAYWLGNRQLDSDIEGRVFMSILLFGFVVMMLLLVWLGVSMRNEAKHLDEEWPPKITK